MNYQRLFKFVEDGGTLVVQYNVPEGGAARERRRLPESSMLAHVGPYPITTGRDRVTVEEAPVTFPNPNNRLLHAPNEITAARFRRLGAGARIVLRLRMGPALPEHSRIARPRRKGAHPGGELYTRYGKGVYIFSSYDWFRELPAGVPGAYRLFANMLSAAKVQ